MLPFGYIIGIVIALATRTIVGGKAYGQMADVLARRHRGVRCRLGAGLFNHTARSSVDSTLFRLMTRQRAMQPTLWSLASRDFALHCRQCQKKADAGI